MRRIFERIRQSVMLAISILKLSIRRVLASPALPYWVCRWYMEYSPMYALRNAWARAAANQAQRHTRTAPDTPPTTGWLIG